jgi:hypothetical protein
MMPYVEEYSRKIDYYVISKMMQYNERISQFLIGFRKIIFDWMSVIKYYKFIIIV